METTPIDHWARDKRGRRSFSPAQRAELLKEFGGSGLSANRFAAIKNIPSTTFSKWVRKSRGQGVSSGVAAGASTPVAFAEVELPSPGSPILLELGHELRLRLPAGVSPQWLAALIRELQPRS